MTSSRRFEEKIINLGACKCGVDCIKTHVVKRGKIDGLTPEKFVENAEEESILHLIDVDFYNGREMNFGVYSELSGIFELWVDAAPRVVDDVMDVLVSGADLAVVNDALLYRRTRIEDILELTVNVALKSYNLDMIKRFQVLGGKKVITSKNIAVRLSSGEIYLQRRGAICKWTQEHQD